MSWDDGKKLRWIHDNLSRVREGTEGYVGGQSETLTIGDGITNGLVCGWTNQARATCEMRVKKDCGVGGQGTLY